MGHPRGRGSALWLVVLSAEGCERHPVQQVSGVCSSSLVKALITGVKGGVGGVGGTEGGMRAREVLR